MHGVKFYSEADFSVASNLQNLKNVIDTFDSSRTDYSINEVIEFFNILKYIAAGVTLKEWTDADIKKNKEIAKIYERIIGTFCRNIDDDNFLKAYEEVDQYYSDNFWEIIEKYKVYERISEIAFDRFLESENTHLAQILKNKKIVDFFGKSIRDCLLKDEKNAELILNKYEVQHITKSDCIYFPSSFTISDKEKVIQNYIRSLNPNLNYLRIIFDVQNSKDAIEISPKTRLEAKKKIEEEEKLFDQSSGITYGASVEFCENQKEISVIKNIDKTMKCTYSLRWIQDYKDYCSLLIFNFIFLFNYADKQMRVTLVNKYSELGITGRYLFMHSKNSYTFDVQYHLKDMLSNLQIINYYKQLENLDIRLEGIIEWFFKDYLLNEFQICDYRIIMPSQSSSYLEKCRAILPEMESVLKQFTLFVEDKKIDHELLQISSGPLLYKDCKSLVRKKYVYANQAETRVVEDYLFSDQCMLSYISRIGEKYTNFFELIRNEKVSTSDYSEYQIRELTWLEERNIIKINAMGYIEFTSAVQISILKDLNSNEVISYWNCSVDIRQEIDGMVQRDQLRFEDTLFSKPEQDYLNYHMNKATFNNSLDLRNRYSHGTQPSGDTDENKHRENYMIILKLLILCILKINDELCITDNIDYIQWETHNIENRTFSY